MATFGDLSGYFFGNFRDRASSIILRYATHCDWLQNEWPRMTLSGYFMSKSLFGQHFLTQSVWLSQIIVGKVINIIPMLPAAENGIAPNCNDRLWWHLAEIFKILYNKVCKFQFLCRFAFFINFSSFKPDALFWLMVKGLDIYIPPLSRKVTMGWFTIRSGVLTAMTLGRAAQANIGSPLPEWTDFGTRSLQFTHLTTPTATFPEICNGLLFRSILRMCVQNWKFVALPVPEIIGGTEKISAVPGYAHAPFSPQFLRGICLHGRCEYTCQIWSS